MTEREGERLGSSPAPVHDLAIELRQAGTGTVVEVAGEIDLVTAPRLQASLEQALRADPRLVVVDLSRVTFLGTSGLNVLVDVNDRAGSTMRVVVNARIPRRAIEVTGLDRHLSIFPTVDAALTTEQ